MQRRTFLQGLAAAGVLGSVPFSLAQAASVAGSVSVESLPKLEGDLTLGKAGFTRMFSMRLKSAILS